MKKQLRFLLAVLFVKLACVVSAKDITFLPSEFIAVASADYSLTKEGITMTVTSSTVNDSQFRIFKSQSITFKSNSYDLIKIVFICTANGTAKYGPGNFAAEDGYTFETEGNKGTWVGDASTVSLYAEIGQIRATQIVVTLSDDVIVVLDTALESISLDKAMGKSAYDKAKRLVDAANAAKAADNKDAMYQIVTEINDISDEIINSINLF